MNVMEMMERGIRLCDLSPTELCALHDDPRGQEIRYAITAEIVRRLTYGTGAAVSANPELPLAQR